MGGFRIFSVAGIPVHITAWYFIILLFWLQGGVQSGLIWGGAITLSILVHELGHGFVAKYFRLNPSIELHGWGGLCHHQRAASDKHDALILIAGPGAGLLLGAVVYVASLAVDAVLGPQLLMFHPVWAPFVRSLLYVNFFWSFVNLAPLWPLDGGQLFRLGMLRVTNAARAERITHIIGAVLGVAACFIAFSWMNSRFLALIAGLLTWMNVRRINESSATGPIRSQNRHAKAVLKQAREAYEARDWETAARFAYQAKAESDLDPSTIRVIFEVLGVSNAAMGRFQEAWPFLLKSPDSRNVFLAKVECVLALEDRAGAATLTGHPLASELPPDVASDLSALARPRG